MKTDQYTVGLRGEAAAEACLTEKGFNCIERRYRAQDGEIDLIMDDHGVLVFIEVKHRPRGRMGDGLLAVTPAKQRRMIHAALAYLAGREELTCAVRFDVVEITSDGIRHVPDAFRCTGW